MTEPGSVTLDAHEQAVMDALLGVMRTITREWGMHANGSELVAAVHVVQGFIVQHMLHRLSPENWSDWSVYD